MAFLGNSFDPNSVPPQQDMAPIPSGEYQAAIVESDMKPTKKNDGQYLELEYEVVEGPFKGRKVWARLNLDNPSEMAVQIAQQQLSAVCAACHIKNAITDSAQLHNIPHVIRVEFQPANDKRQRDGNEVKAWKAIEGGAASAAPFKKPAGAAPAAAKPGAKPDWASKGKAAAPAAEKAE